MKILFIDTSLSNLVIGIVDNSKLLYSKSIRLNNELSIYVFPYLEEAFNSCNMKPTDIDIIMVVEGPGSFTGVRIGITIAKVYAWTLAKKIIPISSLRAMALSSNNYDYVVPIIDARSDSYYASIYNYNNEIIMNEKYISKKQLIDEISKLDGKVNVISDNEFNIDDLRIKKESLDILKIVEYYNDNEGVSPHQLVPNYLKQIDVEKSL